MIFNIVDHRTRRYRWREINAVIEATSHDNACKDSDQMEPGRDDIVCEALKGASLQEAIAWADSQPSAVTLYIYDKGDGIE